MKVVQIVTARNCEQEGCRHADFKSQIVGPARPSAYSREFHL
jgi:hypothetical protein